MVGHHVDYSDYACAAGYSHVGFHTVKPSLVYGDEVVALVDRVGYDFCRYQLVFLQHLGLRAEQPRRVASLGMHLLGQFPDCLLKV